MALLVLFLVLAPLTVIGLMPGSHNQRGELLVVVLGAFIVFTAVYLTLLSRDQARNKRAPRRKDDEWKSTRKRRDDLRLRRHASSRGRSRSRVLGFGSGLSSGRPRIRQASLRRQDELRVSQGIRDAARERADARRHRGERARSDVEAPIDRRHLEAHTRLHSKRPQGRPLPLAGLRRQEEMRIAQGRAYATADDGGARHITETAGERKKRDRLRKRRKRFWQEIDWGSSTYG